MCISSRRGVGRETKTTEQFIFLSLSLSAGFSRGERWHSGESGCRVSLATSDPLSTPPPPLGAHRACVILASRLIARE